MTKERSRCRDCLFENAWNDDVESESNIIEQESSAELCKASPWLEKYHCRARSGP